MLREIEGQRRRGQQRMRRLDGITDSMEVSLSKPRRWWRPGRPGVLRSTGSQRAGHNWGMNGNNAAGARWLTMMMPRLCISDTVWTPSQTNRKQLKMSILSRLCQALWTEHEIQSHASRQHVTPVLKECTAKPGQTLFLCVRKATPLCWWGQIRMYWTQSEWQHQRKLPEGDDTWAETRRMTELRYTVAAGSGSRSTNEQIFLEEDWKHFCSQYHIKNVYFLRFKHIQFNPQRALFKKCSWHAKNVISFWVFFFF